MTEANNNEILQLYRYLVDRNSIAESNAHEYNTNANTDTSLSNFHRTDKIKVKAKGFTYKRITKIKSIRL